MKEIKKYLDKKLNDNDVIILACSGGPDSMFLFHVLKSINKKIKIVCAHVNHNIRKESNEEYKYVEDLCNKNKIIFEGYVIKDRITNNFEDTARKIRYKFFNNLFDKYNAKYILTAHHNDDLIETVLMRISRGSNLPGYIGIKKEDGRYLRVLLDISKEEIITYLDDNKIKYFIDYTNTDASYTRNRFRHNIVSKLKEENSNIKNKIIQFSKELKMYDDFVNLYIKNHRFIKDNILDLKKVLKEDILVIKKCIELIIKEIQKNNQLDVSNNNINDIIDMLFSKRSNIKINLNNNFIAKKSYDKFMIIKEIKRKSVLKIFNDYYEDEMWIIKKNLTSESNSNFEILLLEKEINLPLYIRGMKKGDVMEVKNLGHKKVKDIFIDSKIDVDERKSYPIVVDSQNNILWIPGIKKSKYAKDKEEKYDIILFSERKKNN